MRLRLRSREHQEALTTRPRKDAKEWSVSSGWGNAIHWWRYENMTVVGWKTPKPVAGDVLVCDMESGRKGRYVFGRIRPCNDPPDMFFADMVPLGYVE